MKMMATISSSPLQPLEMEGAASRLEGPGTEEIEEMGHHEDGEEERLLVAGQSVGRSEAHVEQVHETRDAGVLENIEQHEEQDEEAAAHTQDIFIHRAGEDEALAVSRLVPHHALRGRQRSRAMAAKVSMMRFTHSICVTVSGLCVPMKAPLRTMKHAATLTVS